MTSISEELAQVHVDDLKKTSIKDAYLRLKCNGDAVLHGIANLLNVPWSAERVPTVYGICSVIFGKEADEFIVSHDDYDKYFTIPNDPKYVITPKSEIPKKENVMNGVGTLVSLLKSHHDKTLHHRLLEELNMDSVRAIGEEVGLNYKNYVSDNYRDGDEMVMDEIKAHYISEIVKRLEKYKSEAHYIFDCKVVTQSIAEGDSMSIRCKGDIGEYVYTVIVNTTLPLKNAETNSGIHRAAGETYQDTSPQSYLTYDEALAAAENIVESWVEDYFTGRLPYVSDFEGE